MNVIKWALRILALIALCPLWVPVGVMIVFYAFTHQALTGEAL